MAEVYGEAFLETVRDKLVALMTALKTTMAAGYDPTFSYVYETHDVAKLQLNAVSVAGGDSYEDQPLWSGEHTSRHMVEFTIRVHTNYADDNVGIDDQKNARLLNSIITKLLTNLDMGDYYRFEGITELKVAEDFGMTTGGELTCVVSVSIEYTQE